MPPQKAYHSTRLTTRSRSSPSILTSARGRWLQASGVFARAFAALVKSLHTSSWPEIAFLAQAAVAYGFSITSMDTRLVLPGVELQSHIGFMELFNRWLRGQSPFPLWNPIPGYGRSLIADPFLFVFNPFISAPLAIFGMINGPKIAVLLHLFIGGLGAWLLARVVGFGRPTRMWCGLLYMMAGAFPAHLNVGQFQLSMSLSWLPWSIAGVIWALKDERPIALALGSLAQALFFFSGNLYHQTYAAFAILLIGIVYLAHEKKAKLRATTVRRFLLVGLLSLGLIAVQLLPMVASRRSMENEGGLIPGDTEFSGSQRPEHAVLNYLVSDRWFYVNDNLDRIAFLQEGYRFVGVAPFILLLFLVPAYRQGNRKDILAFAACFSLFVGWASLKYTGVRFMYQAVPFLYQFRFPGRALSVGALFLVMLSGFGLNYLWNLWLEFRKRTGRSGTQRAGSQGGAALRGAALRGVSRRGGSQGGATLRGASRRGGSRRGASRLSRSTLANAIRPIRVHAVEALLLVGMAAGLARPFEVNRELFVLLGIYDPQISPALVWLNKHHPESLTIEAHDSITRNMTLFAYRHGYHVLSFIDGWRAAGAPVLLGDPGTLQVKPPLLMDWDQAPLETMGYPLEYQWRGVRLWYDPSVHPEAFLIPASRLDLPGPIGADEVLPVISYERPSVNSLSIVLDAKENGILVVTESWFDGWRVLVDGERASLVSVSDFLAVRVSPGRHSVIFEYAPASFTAGLAISGLTLLVMLGIVIRPLSRRLKRPRQRSVN